MGVNDNDSNQDRFRDLDNGLIDGEKDLADLREIQVVLNPAGPGGGGALLRPGERQGPDTG